jgi:rhamnose transport system permease protein
MSATAQPAGPPTEEAEPQCTLENPRSLVDFVLRARTFGIVGILALFVIVTTLLQSSFLSGSNIRFVLSDATLYALVAIGETFVVLTRNVDLSVGSVVGLSAYVSADMFQAHPGTAIPVVFLVGIGIGIACGVVTGLITAIGRVPSLVVTLAMLYIIRGVDTIVVGSGQVVANSLPDSFINIFHATILGIPDVAIVTAVLVAAAAYYLRSYRSGRDLYAIGSDPDAARLAGIPIARRVFGAFVLSGAIAGLGGVLWATQYNTIDATAATGLELQIVAAVVVGGVGDLRRQRQRRRRRARRTAAADDQRRAQRARRAVAVDRGDRRLPADRRDQPRPRDPAAAGLRAAQTEGSPWRLRRPRPSRRPRRTDRPATAGGWPGAWRARCAGTRRSSSRSPR